MVSDIKDLAIFKDTIKINPEQSPFIKGKCAIVADPESKFVWLLENGIMVRGWRTFNIELPNFVGYGWDHHEQKKD
jgi:hypothetical protein